MKKIRKILNFLFMTILVISLVACNKPIILKQDKITLELGSVSVTDKQMLKSKDVIMKNILDTKDEKVLKSSKIKFDKKVKNNERGYLPLGTYATTVTIDENNLALKVVVKDTIAPKLVNPKAELTYEQGTKDIDLEKEFTAEDFSDYKVLIKYQTFEKNTETNEDKKKESKSEQTYLYTDTEEVDFEKVGDYYITVIVVDDAKNESEPFACKIVIKEKEKTAEEMQQDAEQANKDTTVESTNDEQANTAGGGTTATVPSNPSADTGVMYSLINNQRMANGLNSLSIDPNLANAAAIRAQEITTSFSHQRPNGQMPDSLGMSGENLSMVTGDTYAVFNAFMGSPVHKANIVNGSFTRMGVAFYYANGTVYWVQAFGY